MQNTAFQCFSFKVGCMFYYLFYATELHTVLMLFAVNITFWIIKKPLIIVDFQRFSSISLSFWRRDRDSNPRTPCEVNSFRDCPVRPLRHLSLFYYNEEFSILSLPIAIGTTTPASLLYSFFSAFSGRRMRFFEPRFSNYFCY